MRKLLLAAVICAVVHLVPRATVTSGGAVAGREARETTSLFEVQDTLEYYCDFEYGDCNWTPDNPDDPVWEVGHPDSVVVPHSGQNCAATTLDGHYPDFKDRRLISSEFLLPSITTGQVLVFRFWHWFSFGYNDVGRVEIRFDSAGGWQAWTAISSDISLSSGIWSPCQAEITRYAGKRVQFSFSLVQYPYWEGVSWGWYIDDLAIIRVSSCIQGPVELDPQWGWSDWWVTNGQWEIGEPDSQITAPHSPPFCAGTVLEDLYVDNTESRLVSPSICLPAIDPRNEALYFRFWHWFSFGYNDVGRVEISVDTSGGWQPWRPVLDYFPGTINDWRRRETNVSAYSEKRVRFSFFLDQYPYWEGVSWGWYIDDPEVTILSDTVLVLRPNVDEILEIGDSLHVYWDFKSYSGFFDSVTIDLSRNGGNTWEPLAREFNDGYWYWPVVTGPPSGRCLIRISDAADGFPSDVSDTYFTIGEGELTLWAPNGGEVFETGSTHTISWTCDPAITNVKLEYTTNGGTNWNPIIPVPCAQHSYQWTIPATPSARCKVRVCDAAIPSVCDASDGYFSIVIESVRLSSPNGSNTFCANDVVPISWTAAGVDSVVIDFSSDGGASWNPIVTRWPASAPFSWEVPVANSQRCLVRACDLDGFPCDQSDTTFTISHDTLVVHAPAGDTTYLAGSFDMILWASTCVDSIKIEFSADAGGTWQWVAGPLAASDASYPWQVPDTSSRNCLLRICDLNGGSCDTSGVFEITRKSIAIPPPIGNEPVCAGNTLSIEWESHYVDSVTIDYSLDNGGHWSTLVSCVEDTGRYAWVVPDTSDSTCRIKICDCSDSPCATSEATFTILSTPRAPELASPADREAEVSLQPTFRWNPVAFADSYLLQVDDDPGFSSPEANVGLTGTTYEYSGLSCGQTYSWRVRARNACGDGSWSARSFATIDSALIVTSPQAGDTVCIQTRDTLAWEEYCIRWVTIEYSPDSGKTWYEILTDTPAQGDHPWTPRNSCPACLVRVCNNTRTTCDTSSFFSVRGPSITLEHPGPGEVFDDEDTVVISWHTNPCFAGNVTIEYSVDAGRSWGLVEDFATNDGNHAWIVPPVNSDSCLVRISDSNNPNIADQSDAFFALRTLPMVLDDMIPHLYDWVRYDSPFIFHFSRTINPASVNPSTLKISGCDGYPYSWSSVFPTPNTIEVHPNSTLRSLDTVRVILTGGIEDIYDQAWDVNADGNRDPDSAVIFTYQVFPLGDCNYDAMVNGDDVVCFTQAWHTQDSFGDIGPTFGQPPHLWPQPDGSVNFEDLAVFVWMWNWAFTSGASLVELAPDGWPCTGNDLLVALEGDPESPGGDCACSFAFPKLDNILAARFILVYDPVKVQVDAIRKGSLLSIRGVPTAFIHAIDNQRGRAEVACSRLQGALQGVGGTDSILELQWSSPSRESEAGLTVYYKVWSTTGEIIAAGQSQISFSGFASGQLPFDHELGQNFPNPFNPSTTIPFELQAPGRATLEVFNILGERVDLVLDENLSAGRYAVSWRALDDKSGPLCAGIYFYRLTVDSWTRVRKMILVR